MEYKITPLRTFKEYEKVSEEETYAAANLLFDRIIENEDCFIDRGVVLDTRLTDWMENKRNLAYTPLFSGASKFQLEITDIEQSDEEIIGAVKECIDHRSSLYLDNGNLVSFDHKKNYFNFIKEQALEIEPTEIFYPDTYVDAPLNEGQVLTTKVEDRVGNILNRVLNQAALKRVSNKERSAIISPEVAVAVYKFLVNIGIIETEEDDRYWGHEIRYCMDYYAVNTILDTFDCPLIPNTEYYKKRMSYEYIELDSPEDWKEAMSRGERTIQGVVNEEGNLTQLRYNITAYIGLPHGYRIYYKDYDINELDKELINNVYHGLIKSLYIVTKEIDAKSAEKVCEVLKAENLANSIGIAKQTCSNTILAELAKYIDALSRQHISEMHHYIQRIALEIVAVTLYRPIVGTSVNGAYRDLLPSKIITEINEKFAKELNQCSTLNKQLAMIERKLTNEQYSFIFGHKYQTYPQEQLLNHRYGYTGNLRRGFDNLFELDAWNEFKQQLADLYQDEITLAAKLTKTKNFRREHHCNNLTTDILKINNADKYVLPKSETWIVSLEAKDILTASVNNNGWSSCHASSYANSPMTLAANDITFVIYKKSSKDMVYNDIHIDNKKVRAYGHYLYSENGSASLIIEQSYPHGSKIIEDIIPGILGELGTITSKEVDNIKYDLHDDSDYADLTVAGYFDLFEAHDSRFIGDFTINPDWIVNKPAPDLWTGEVDEYLPYGEFGNLNIFLNGE